MKSGQAGPDASRRADACGRPTAGAGRAPVGRDPAAGDAAGRAERHAGADRRVRARASSDGAGTTDGPRGARDERTQRAPGEALRPRRCHVAHRHEALLDRRGVAASRRAPAGNHARDPRDARRAQGVRGAARASFSDRSGRSSATTSSRSPRSFREHPTPMKTQRATAWEVLASEAQEQALTSVRAPRSRAKWRARTTCARDLRRATARAVTAPGRRVPAPNPKHRAENSYIRRTSATPVAQGFGAAYGRLNNLRRGLGVPCA